MFNIYSFYFLLCFLFYHVGFFLFVLFFFFLMIRRPPRSTRTDTLFPYTTLFRSGYMVWCALAYAGVGSTLTWLVGRPLIRLNAERFQRESELRFALVRFSENADSVALHAGEADEIGRAHV